MKKYSYYKFEYKGRTFISQYMGREEHFECMVCGKGNNAYCFNVFDTLEEYNNCSYETFSFGKEHLPKLEEINIEDIEKEMNK